MLGKRWRCYRFIFRVGRNQSRPLPAAGHDKESVEIGAQKLSRLSLIRINRPCSLSLL